MRAVICVAVCSVVLLGAEGAADAHQGARPAHRSPVTASQLAARRRLIPFLAATEARHQTPIGGQEDPFWPTLVVPEVEMLAGSETAAAASAVRLSTPGRTAARALSETAYAGADRREAQQIDDEAFPSNITEAALASPELPPGARVLRFHGARAAEIALPSGRHAVLDSLQPIDVERRAGERVPIDLALHEHQGVFQPAAPAVAVALPANLAAGMSITSLAVSLTPVDAQGSPLAATGAIDGASVFYGASARDTDTVAKPTVAGFALESILRASDSPRQLYFRVHAPVGAVLRPAAGGVDLVYRGAPIALISAPGARDAAGSAIRVLTSVAGDVVRLDVAPGARSVQYPVDVDPTVTDTKLTYNPGAWTTATKGGFTTWGWGVRGKPYEEGGFSPGDFGFWEYPTQGQSHIYAFKATATSHWGTYAQSSLRIENPSGQAETQPPVTVLPTGQSTTTICVSGSSCQATGVTAADERNAAFYQVSADEKGWSGEGQVESAAVQIEQEAAPSAEFDTSDATIEGLTNALHPGVWSTTTAPLSAKYAIGVRAYDPGVGVSTWRLNGASLGWGFAHRPYLEGRCENPSGVQCTECHGFGPTCESLGLKAPLAISLSEASKEEGLPEGEPSITSSVRDSVGLSSSELTAHPKIDNSPPHGIKLLGLPANGNVNDAEHELVLHAEATDGVTGTPSSGVASLALSLDGEPVGTASGECAEGPCTASSAQWTIDLESLAAGRHTLTVTATDKVGNADSENYLLTVHRAAPITLGPGAVNPVSGELKVSATDVHIAAPGAPLTVGREYSSHDVSTEGPLGPQWTLSLGPAQSLTRTSLGSVILLSSSGETVFEPIGKGLYKPAAGDGNLTLREEHASGISQFELKAAAGNVIFRHPSGSTTTWVPSEAQGATSTGAVTYAFATVNGYNEPTEELAPVASGVSCAVTKTRGCRVLTFNYATKTTATGEAPSAWGDYNGHLTRVYFTAWDPATNKMSASITVAQYSYDAKGRLRAEWDPRISPALQTVYGYDAQGHLTALSAPKRQPWLLSYGIDAGDPAGGRLLAISRPNAATPLNQGEAPAATGRPTLSSTTPAVGSKVSVASNGTWENSPLSYSYRWEVCNATGAECAAIGNAYNTGYYPSEAYVGRTLRLAVTATNADGSTSETSTTTAPIATGKPVSETFTPPNPGANSVWTIDYRVPLTGGGAPQMSASETRSWGQTDDPEEATAIFPPDEPQSWPSTDYRRATIYYLDNEDRQVNISTPGTGISTTEYNEQNEVMRTLSPEARQSALAEGSRSIAASQELDTETTYSADASEIVSTLGPLHTVRVAGNPVSARRITHYYYDENEPAEGAPHHLLTKTTTAALVAGKEEELHSTLESYSGQNNLGWTLRKPTSSTVDPSGLALTQTTLYEPATGNVTETRDSAAGPAGEQPGAFFATQFGKEGISDGDFKSPRGIATTSSGDVLVSDTLNNRVQEFTSAGKHVKDIGATELKEPEGIAHDSKDQTWIADTGNNRIVTYESNGTKGIVIGHGLGYEGYNELHSPSDVAIDGEGHVWVADTEDERIAAYKRELGGSYHVYREARVTAPTGIAIGAEGNVYVTSRSGNAVDEFSPDEVEPISAEAVLIRTFNGSGSQLGQLNAPTGIESDSAGDLWVADTGNSRIVEFGPTGTPYQAFGTKGTGKGQMNQPSAVAIDTQGGLWIADAQNDNVQRWTAHGTGYGTGGKPSAHQTQTIYYSAEANKTYTACGKRPEWAGLACRTQPAAQPEGALPPVPTVTYEYNIWDEPTSITKTSGSSTQTTTITYDPAGRTLTTGVTATSGTSLPTVSDGYDPGSGAMIAQTTTVGETTARVTTSFNSLGQRTADVDASGNESTYTYDIVGRLETLNDGKGSQTDLYNATSGLLSTVTDSAAGTFTAGYNQSGTLTSELYPDGLEARYGYNGVGETTKLEYVKTRGCSTNCTWLTETAARALSGKILAQETRLTQEGRLVSAHAYTYDAGGRLTSDQETREGAGCTTREYAYDADSNVASAATFPPGTAGACTHEGGTTEQHTYDQADRLSDSGVGYDPFGDTTTVPTGDVGAGELTTSYYAGGEVHQQTQKPGGGLGEQAVTYQLDPLGRVEETIATGEQARDTISHYTGDSDSPAWESEPTSGRWSRYIPGLTGGLAAIQESGAAPVLQLADLHGDIIATAPLGEPTPKLKEEPTTPYGAPIAAKHSRYSWLGGLEVPTEFNSGVTAMGSRTYLPRLGRFLQEDPVLGGSANAYAYTFADPVNGADPTGAYSASTEEWALHGAERVANEAVKAREAELAAIKAAEEAAARAQAEREIAAAAAARAALCESGDYNEKFAMGCAPSLMELAGAAGGGTGPSSQEIAEEELIYAAERGELGEEEGEPIAVAAKGTAGKIWCNMKHTGHCNHGGGGGGSTCDVIGWISIFGGPFIPEATVAEKVGTVLAGGLMKEVCG